MTHHDLFGCPSILYVLGRMHAYQHRRHAAGLLYLCHTGMHSTSKRPQFLIAA